MSTKITSENQQESTVERVGVSSFNIRVYGILINNSNQVLVSDELIRGNYFTKFPGGGLEFGEGTRECLVREFKEETGLEVIIGDHIYTTDFFQISAFNNRHQIISIYYYVLANDISKLKTTTKKFNFLPEQIADKVACAESFRWIDLQNINADEMSLPIDKIVADILLEKQSTKGI